MADCAELDDRKQSGGSKTGEGNYQRTAARNYSDAGRREPEAGPKLSEKNRRFIARILIDFCRRFLRGFSGGLVAYAGLRTLAVLFRRFRKKSAPSVWKSVSAKDCLRVATFCALYPSIYHLLAELLRFLQKQTNGWIYGVAGGLAGLSVAVLDKSKRQTLALFTLSRALGASLSVLVRRGHLPALPYFEVGVFSACTSLITYCTTVKPQYLNEGYYRSVLKWSRDYKDRIFQVFYREPGSRFVTCQEVGFHEGNCVPYMLMSFLHGIQDYISIYFPIHAVPVIVFKRKALRDRPLLVIKTLAKNTVMSTLFLSTMMFLIKVTLCKLRNISHQPPPAPAFIPFLAGAVSGFGLLFERYSRRKEVALFVFYQVLTIFHKMTLSTSIRPYLRVPHGLTFMFALSMMVVMHAYEREPDSLSPLVKGFLKFFVGAKNSGSVIISEKS